MIEGLEQVGPYVFTVGSLIGMLWFVLRRKDPVHAEMVELWKNYLDKALESHSEQRRHIEELNRDVAHMKGQGGCRYDPPR